jgi:hypothetical protein
VVLNLFSILHTPWRMLSRFLFQANTLLEVAPTTGHVSLAVTAAPA